MQLVDVKIMAGILGVKTSWIYANIERQSESGRIPHLRVGKHLRFDPEAVLAWLRTRNGEA